MTGGVYIPHDTLATRLVRMALRLALGTVEGIAALACISLFGAGVACLALVLTR